MADSQKHIYLDHKPGQYFSFPVSKETFVVVRTYFFGFVFAIPNNTQKASNVLLIHTFT